MINIDRPLTDHSTSMEVDNKCHKSNVPEEEIDIINTSSKYSGPSLRSKTIPMNEGEEMIWIKLCAKSKAEFHGDALTYDLYSDLF